LCLLLPSFVKQSKTLLHLDEHILIHAVGMNFLIRVDVAFVAGKLNGFFANMAILIYMHIMSTYSARIDPHDVLHMLFVLSRSKVSAH